MFFRRAMPNRITMTTVSRISDGFLIDDENFFDEKKC